MFSSKGKQESQKVNNTSTLNADQNTNVISQGTVIEGKFKSTEDIRIDGTVCGEIFTEKRLVMGESGNVEGTIRCNESSIKGKIEGELSVKGLLHLLSTAFIKGKIQAKKMIVDEGASYNGECLIGEQHFKKNPVKV